MTRRFGPLSLARVAASAVVAALMTVAGPPATGQVPRLPSLPFQLDLAKLSVEQAAEARRLTADSVKRREVLDEELGRLLGKPKDAFPPEGPQGPAAGGMVRPGTPPASPAGATRSV